MPEWLKRELEFLRGRYFLYFVILKYEKIFRDLGFNRDFLNYEKVLMMLERMGVQAVEDRSLKAPFLWCERGRKVVFYSSEVYPEELTLKLGHELGHVICEHCRESSMWIKSVHRIFSNRMEREADVIGYLCWIPTPYLERVAQWGWDAGEVMEDLITCDTELAFLEKRLPSRFQIYREYLEARKEILSFRKKAKDYWWGWV